jgi:hypothetical protein
MTIRCIPALFATACILSPALATAQTPAAPAATATASPTAADPKIEALAKDLLHRTQADTLDRSQMTDQMAAQMTPAYTKNVATQMASLGNYTSFTYVGTQQSDGLTVYQFAVVFNSMTLNEYVAITPDGKIAGLRFSK